MDQRHALVREILMAEWDPIGVRDEPAAADEYDSYVIPLATMLARKSNVDEIAGYLLRVEGESMGLRPDAARAQSAARKLLSLVEESGA